MAVAWQKEF
jgi:transcription antitermination factor NusG